MSFATGAGPTKQEMRAPANPVVHLELHTGNLPRACGFYTSLFDWRAETVHIGARSYLTLGLGNRIEGGVTEADIEQPLWIPYVEVDNVTTVTQRASQLGASVELGPREGPAGWRSVIAPPAGAAIALWQPKPGGLR